MMISVSVSRRKKILVQCKAAIVRLTFFNQKIESSTELFFWVKSRLFNKKKHKGLIYPVPSWSPEGKPRIWYIPVDLTWDSCSESLLKHSSWTAKVYVPAVCRNMSLISFKIIFTHSRQVRQALKGVSHSK